MPDAPAPQETQVDVLNVIKRTVEPPQRAADMTYPIGDSLIIRFASVADVIPKWGSMVRDRDKQLKEFMARESMLVSAVYNICVSNASFRWEVQTEDDQLKETLTHMLATSQLGDGWSAFVSRLTIGLLSQDNGGFIEIVRSENRFDAPVIGLRALESSRCLRTGDPRTPVIYETLKGRHVPMPWYRIVPMAEMPSDIESMRGMQYCAITRILQFAQILRDVMVYRGEKVGGRFERAIHIVGGPAKSEIERARLRSQDDADATGLTKYVTPTIIASLDPSKPVSHVEIPLASLPDNFNYEEEMKWYITTMALAFGRDYQDFAPLPGGNLGTSHQSEILHQKSKGKGPANFMGTLSYIMNYRGPMPFGEAKFAFKELDSQDESDRMKILRLRAETRKTLIESGEITPSIAREMAVEAGDYDKRFLAMAPTDEEIRGHEMALVQARARNRTGVYGDGDDENAPPGNSNPPPKGKPFTKEGAEMRRPFGANALLRFKQRIGWKARLRAFLKKWRPLVWKLYTREILYIDFTEDAYGLLTDELFDAYYAGLESVVSEEERRIYEEAGIVLDIFDINMSRAIDFGAEIDAGKFDGKPDALDRRIELYSYAIGYLFWEGVASGDPDGMYEWLFGGTKEHCDDCAAYAGQVHPMRAWRSAGALPQSFALGCHGYGLCELRPTNKKETGELYPPGHN